MDEKINFRAIIENPGEGGAYVIVPFDVEKVYGQKRVKIRATIDGVPYRGSLVRMGTSYHVLIILKEIREKIHKTFGDEVEIALEMDTEERVVLIPPDLRDLLEQNSQAEAIFQRLSYSHQKEYVTWIESARQAEIRQARLTKTIRMLLEGKKAR